MLVEIGPAKALLVRAQKGKNEIENEKNGIEKWTKRNLYCIVAKSLVELYPTVM